MLVELRAIGPFVNIVIYGIGICGKCTGLSKSQPQLISENGWCLTYYGVTRKSRHVSIIQLKHTVYASSVFFMLRRWESGMAFV